MKKVFFCLIVSIFFVLPVCALDGEVGDSGLLKNANSGLLMEAGSGEIVYAKNIDEKVSVASMTKMVGQIIILEEIEKGNLKWDEKVTISSNASGMGGSQIYLETGETMTVKDLMKGITMASANDATVAMAERIAGSEEKFVLMMNEKVKKMGLKDTHFVNSTGLDANNHYSTAHDMGLIAKELLQHEQILDISSVYEDYLRVDTPNKFWLVNTNKLVRLYSGADGLKTGFTDKAGYCMAVTAKRKDLRFIAIVLGEKSGKVRNQETIELLDYGFNSYKIDLTKRKSDVVLKLKLDNGNKDSVGVVPIRDVSIMSLKSSPKVRYDIETKINKINYPIKKGDIVGNMLIKKEGKVLKKVPLTVNENIYKIGYINLFGKNLKNILSGNVF